MKFYKSNHERESETEGEFESNGLHIRESWLNQGDKGLAFALIQTSRSTAGLPKPIFLVVKLTLSHNTTTNFGVTIVIHP